MRTSESVQLFLLSRQERMLSENTINLYQWVLNKLQAEFPPDSLPTERYELRPLFNKQLNLSPASQRTIRDRLRVFWAWLEDEGISESNPMVKMPVPRRQRTLPRVLSKEETLRLLEAVPSQRDYAILVVLLDTGLRVGELASLTRTNARPDGLTVYGKVGPRVVPISPTSMNFSCDRATREGFGLVVGGR